MRLFKPFEISIEKFQGGYRTNLDNNIITMTNDGRTPLKNVSLSDIPLDVNIYLLPYSYRQYIDGYGWDTQTIPARSFPGCIVIGPEVTEPEYVILHELGHEMHRTKLNFDMQKMSPEFKKYMELRGIANWKYGSAAPHNKRAEEVFADDFAFAFGAEPNFEYYRLDKPESEVVEYIKSFLEVLPVNIGIDPGHGGVDPGAIGSGGLCENEVTLAVGLETFKLLDLNGLAPVITRTKDVSVSLSRRCDILNMAQCAIAVSIHCNSSGNRSADYVSTFIQAQGGQAERLAIAIQAELVSATGWRNGGVRVQNLHMTRETNMPAVVVEMGFISNPEQERWLKTSENQKKLAEAICKGICVYLGRTYKKEAVDVAGFEGPAKVKYQGKELPAGILEGRTYVELRALAELLGLKVAWDNATKTVTLS